MGQAKRRGTFEQRQAEAIERKEREFIERAAVNSAKQQLAIKGAAKEWPKRKMSPAKLALLTTLMMHGYNR